MIENQYKIDNTTPGKIGDIIDTMGLPFGEIETLEPRLKKFIKKLFNLKSIDDSYWKVFKDMISNPNEIYGLVAIDGFIKDAPGADDIALIFYMGIPKLRGRRVNYLEKTYYRLGRSGDQFFNSYLDDKSKDYNHFHFDGRNPVWHPHVNDANPCLGAFSHDLRALRSEGNPIMYLKIVQQFLNTWNVRSPFWNLNTTVINNKILNGEKEYHTSTFWSVVYQLELHDYHIDFREFINNNLHKINSPTISNDILCLGKIFKLNQYIKPILAERTLDNINNFDYIDIHHAERERRRETSNSYSANEYSIIPQRNVRRNTCLIPYKTGERTFFKTLRLYSSNEWVTDEYRKDNLILSALSAVLSAFYSFIKNKRMVDILFNDANYSIKLYCEYLAPIESKRVIIYDEMTNLGIYDHRVTIKSTEFSKENDEYYNKKLKIDSKYNKRKRRIKRLLTQYYGKGLSKEFISKAIEEEICSYFHWEFDTINNYVTNKGLFWNKMGIYEYNTDFRETVQIIEQFKINSIDTLISAYETIKERSVSTETESLINEYDKIIRSLKKYEYQTNNTEKDTQQVHLSFE